MKERELPEGWECKRLGDVTLKFVNGGTPSTAIPEYWNGSIPWTTSKSITSCTISAGEKFVSKEAVAKSSTNVIPKDNILIASRVGIGKSAVNVIDIAKSQDLTGVILDKKEILPEFLVRYLHDPKIVKALESNARGSTIKGLQRSDLERIEISLPPLSVQHQIVAVLERAEAVTRQRQEADTLTGALLQSVFYEMFGNLVMNEKGWEIVKIRDVTEKSQYGCSVLGTNEGQYPILGMNNLTFEGKIDIKNLKYVNLSEKVFENFKLECGDILFNRTNAPNLVGKTGLFQKGENFVFASYLIRLKLKMDIVDLEYLWTFLNSPYMKNKFSGMCKKAVNQANINAQELQNISIPLPPLALQQQFAHVVQEVEGIREKQAESKKEIDTLFEGLMQRAFVGKLAV